jgi:DNA-binding transcriptional ArsR family regulator
VNIEVRVGGGLEALFGLYALVSVDPDDLDPASWVAVLDARSLRDEVADLVGPASGEVWLHLVGWALTVPDRTPARSLAHRLTRTDPLALRRYVFGVDVPAWRERIDPRVLRRAADGHQPAIDRVLDDPEYYAGQARAALGPLAPLTPDETRRRLHRALKRFVERAVEPIESVTVAGLERWRVAHPVDPGDPLGWLRESAGGFRYRPEPEIRRVVVVPHMAAAPQLLLLQEGGTRIVGVPATPDDTSPERLARVFAALGDAQRLRILRLIAREEAGVSDVARRLGIAKSTAHHHLGALRAAGLLGLAGRAWRYRYEIRTRTIDELSDRLRAVLESDDEEER